MDNFFINPARMTAVSARAIGVEASGDDKKAWDSWEEPDGFCALDYQVVGGTAVIPVCGALASAQIPGWYWMVDVTYENLVATVSAAINDGEVERILLRLNSPGGTVTGCAEAAALLDQFSQQKPLWAHCQMADSAAYWLASAANRIIVDPTGEAGSIGTIMTHVDMSKYLAEMGVDVTHIFSGDKKADGSPYSPLSKDAKARFQAEVDYLRGIFVDSVAAYRKMDSAALLAMQADTYIGQLAVDAGLADETGFFNDVLKAMAGQDGSVIFVQPAITKEQSMAKTEKATKPSDEDKKATKAAGDNGDCTCGDNEPDDDEGETGAEEGKEKTAEKPSGSKEQPAAVDQKARTAAIIRHPEAEGRTELAQHLAFETDLSVEAAAKALAAAPKAPVDKKNGLAEAMKKEGSTKLGSGGVPEQTENATTTDMKRRFAKK